MKMEHHLKDRDLQLIVSAINGFTEAVKEGAASTELAIESLMDRVEGLTDEAAEFRKLLTGRKIVNTILSPGTISLEPKVHD